MNKVVIVGAGGVGGVVAHKCAMVSDVFGDIVLASRTKSKCDAIKKSVKELTGRDIKTAEVDADDVPRMTDFLKAEKPALLINVALPYQDLNLMDACLAAGVHYLDTANYEPLDEAKFEYKWQWAYRERFEKAGLMALLGSGFDPGVTNVFSAYAQKELFDTIETIDILDCNAGSHGHPFATNFNPEINIREITQRGKYWEDGKWIETDPLSVTWDFDFPKVGTFKAYLMYHEEMESLSKNIKGLKRIRFWMTFGEEYLTHLRVLQNVGMTSIEPIQYNGQSIVPLKFLKEVLPNPGDLGQRYEGKTCIGCLVEGTKNGKAVKKFIYNICDHAASFKEVRSQAISYTTGVPAMIGAKLMLEGAWKKPGVWNMEELDPTPFMENLSVHGLPWHIEDRN